MLFTNSDLDKDGSNETSVMGEPVARPEAFTFYSTLNQNNNKHINSRHFYCTPSSLQPAGTTELGASIIPGDDTAMVYNTIDDADEDDDICLLEKQTKGKQKIPIEFIHDRTRRFSTFSKRKTGLMKKAVELAELTGAEVLLLIASETNHVYTYATPRLRGIIDLDCGKELIQTCLNSSHPIDEGKQTCNNPPELFSTPDVNSTVLESVTSADATSTSTSIVDGLCEQPVPTTVPDRIPEPALIFNTFKKAKRPVHRRRLSSKPTRVRSTNHPSRAAHVMAPNVQSDAHSRPSPPTVCSQSALTNPSQLLLTPPGPSNQLSVIWSPFTISLAPNATDISVPIVVSENPTFLSLPLPTVSSDNVATDNPTIVAAAPLIRTLLPKRPMSNDNDHG